jgi:hypothetical protein
VEKQRTGKSQKIKKIVFYLKSDVDIPDKEGRYKKKQTKLRGL